MNLEFAWSWDGESETAALIVEAQHTDKPTEVLNLEGPKDVVKRVFEVLTHLQGELLCAQMKLADVKYKTEIILKAMEAPHAK